MVLVVLKYGSGSGMARKFLGRSGCGGQRKALFAGAVIARIPHHRSLYCASAFQKPASNASCLAQAGEIYPRRWPNALLVANCTSRFLLGTVDFLQDYQFLDDISPNVLNKPPKQAYFPSLTTFWYHSGFISRTFAFRKSSGNYSTSSGI